MLHWVESQNIMMLKWKIVGFGGAELWLVDNDRMIPNVTGCWREQIGTSAWIQLQQAYYVSSIKGIEGAAPSCCKNFIQTF